MIDETSVNPIELGWRTHITQTTYRFALRFVVLLTVMIFLLCLRPVSVSAASHTEGAEFILDGGFELGIIGWDINRFPRYPKSGLTSISSPRRTSVNPIHGRYSLLLPGLTDASYLLIYRTVPLVPMKMYVFGLTARVTKPTEIVLQVFAPNWKVVKKQSYRLDSGTQHISMTFEAASEPLMSKDEVAHKLRIAVSSPQDVMLDEVSLRGDYGVSGPVKRADIGLESDRNLTVYPLGGSGAFQVRVVNQTGERYFYEIDDPIRHEVMIRNELEQGSVQNGLLEKRIPILTDRRGFFRIRAFGVDASGEVSASVTRSYVVINPDRGPPDHRAFFGLCVEEHGQQTHSNALVDVEDMYRMAHQIGVGSVRIFSLAMPDIVSPDGKTFDFTEADRALMLAKKYELQPFIVLGSDMLDRVPAWMRTVHGGSASIDLWQKNGATPAYRGDSDVRFLSLAAYRNYLEHVFRHFKNSVEYYELWNEPGYKFTVDEILQLAKLTREVQKKIDPRARILGYSSTISDGGRGRDPLDLPGFIDQVARHGGLNNIDVLSYHSGHAFEYMGGYNYDKRNLETGFVQRLRKILVREGKSDMPIWDSEFGISWASPHADRIDSQEGTAMAKSKYYKSHVDNVLDVARQLPMVYAAAAANGVERLFWFNMEDSGYDISNTKRKWGLFDGQMEPMPQIAAYDAMTEILGGAKFVKRFDRDDGARVYLFKKGADTVALAYNWQERAGRLTLNQPADRVKVSDVMGNPIAISSDIKSEDILEIDGWPRYVLIKGAMPESIDLK